MYEEKALTAVEESSLTDYSWPGGHGAGDG